MSEPRLIETLDHKGFHLRNGIVERSGGHLLNAQFKQEITSGHHLRHLPFRRCGIGCAISSDFGQVRFTASLGKRTHA